ncbi:MAG: hypothetical protein EAZ37_02395 [Burkholderiales bacterium]|nr:MAG: hypothetical protein EAZ37_02395 [Burkholderiales bacterium]
MRFQHTIIFIALCAVFLPATGQNKPQNDTKEVLSCTAAKDLVNTDLFGAWTLELQGNITTRLTMERNPEFAESLAGNFLLSNMRHDIFGDIEDGALDLEESNNGKDIIAIWKGRVQEGSCGKAISGQRRLTSSGVEQSFVLRRAGW